MLNVQRASGALCQTSMKLEKRNGCGQRCDESAWFVDISAVSPMKTNGNRKAIASAIRTECRAMPMRSLRRFRGRRVMGTAAAVIAGPPRAPNGAS